MKFYTEIRVFVAPEGDAENLIFTKRRIVIILTPDLVTDSDLASPPKPHPRRKASPVQVADPSDSVGTLDQDWAA